MWGGEFHFTSNKVRYFTISVRKLFHIRRTPNISLKPVCVRILIATLKKYLFRSLYTTSTDSNAKFESVFFCFIRKIYLYLCSHRQTLHSCTISKAKSQYSQGIKHNFKSAIWCAFLTTFNCNLAHLNITYLIAFRVAYFSIVLVFVNRYYLKQILLKT